MQSKTGSWRCFVRRTSPNRVLITLVPTSFADLKAIMVPNQHLEQHRGVKLLAAGNDTVSASINKLGKFRKKNDF